MKKIVLWVLSFFITVFTLVYQRMTGPTYPLKGKIELANTEISFRLPRSHEITSDCKVQIPVNNPDIEGRLIYKRFKTQDLYTRAPMLQENGSLVAYLPKQPPAGKLEYRVILSHKTEEKSLPAETPVIIRFKGIVPTSIIIPHVFIVFLALLFSSRTGLEALKRKSHPRKLALWTTLFLFLGGMVFGPLMQWYAFGAFWTGFPFGRDLTDNKTLIALIAWLIALFVGQGKRSAWGWILGASLITLIVFYIPHSLLGSELDYSKMENQPPLSRLYSYFYGPPT